MANWYCGSADYVAVAQFQISHAYTIGNIVRQLATPTVGNERCFRCTTAGTSGGSESAWTLTKGSTTTQGTAVFTEVTGNETYQSAGAWAAPHALLSNATNSSWAAAGDTVYVAANHAESTASAPTYANGSSAGTPFQIICVDNSGTGHVPPQSGDARTTATITTTGSNAITINFFASYIYGIAFVQASGGTLSNVFVMAQSGSGANYQRYDACSFKIANTGSSGSLSIGQNLGSYVEWNNCVFITANAGHSIQVNKGKFVWRNTAACVTGTATSGGVFIDSNAGGLVLCDGLDFSGLSHTKLVAPAAPCSEYVFVNCKINSSTVVANTPTAPGEFIDAIGTDSGSATYRQERWAYTATLTTETAAVHTSGASDGTTTISWKIVTTANCKWQLAFEAFPIAAWNTLTGSSHTVSFEAIVNASAVLTNAQLWADMAYLGTSSSILASTSTTGRSDILTTATNVTASTQAWDGAATARQNSHAYNLGDVIKLASNSGRLFFCTTAGTSAGSEPGGYASAVDGGSVTDSGAVFRAGCRMTVSLSITPQVVGLIRVLPKVGVASTTLYIDPLLKVV